LPPFTAAFGGHPGCVQLSDIAEFPFKLGAELRHRRAFHPIGVLARGRVERIAPVGKGLPVESGEVTARLSKGAGLPGELPDFAGLAWRMGRRSPAATPWDVLMVSAGSSALGRVVLRPARSWPHTTFSTLMPLGYGGRAWWVRARFLEPTTSSGLSLDSLSEALRGGTAIRIAVDQSEGLGAFAPLAVLTLTDLLPNDDHSDVALDPTRNSAPGVTLLPQWLTALRQGAYRGSRKGRHEANSVDSQQL
jgi:hypothetical protein